MFLCRFAALSVFVVLSLPAAPRVPQPIWPHGAPGPANTTGTEHDTTKATDNRVAGRPVIRTGDVSNPTLAFYPAPKPNASGATVVVFPGGAYRILALDLEGTEVCEWLNSIGVNAVLVKYRVPEPEGVPRHQEPLQDAQRAMGIVRAHSTEWNIDSHHVGVLGFSAGGHLAAALSTNYEKRTYDPIDAADQQSCKPDFTVLVYPGYLVSPAEGPQLSSELVVNAQTPPTFLVQTEDDPVHMENSLFYYLALKRAKVPAELHLYPKGGHGYGLRKSADAVTAWPARAAEWMRSCGFLR